MDTNNLIYGADTAVVASNPALTPKDAWSIDKKLDDGLPATGIVQAVGQEWYSATAAAAAAATATDPATPAKGPNSCALSENDKDNAAGYNLLNLEVSCALSFPNPF